MRVHDCRHQRSAAILLLPQAAGQGKDFLVAVMNRPQQRVGNRLVASFVPISILKGVDGTYGSLPAVGWDNK